MTAPFFSIPRPVPGLMGTLQALETIKLLLPGVGPSFSGRLLLVDGETGAFRTVSLRSKQKECAVCSDGRVITSVERVDYAAFCGRPADDKVKRSRDGSIFNSIV